MSDLRADCDWHDGTLFLVLPEDPERIAVRLFHSRQAPSRMYVPEEEVVKLRELVRHLYECMCNIDADSNRECDSCEYDNTEGKCDFERLMRELGMEVD